MGHSLHSVGPTHLYLPLANHRFCPLLDPFPQTRHGWRIGWPIVAAELGPMISETADVSSRRISLTSSAVSQLPQLRLDLVGQQVELAAQVAPAFGHRFNSVAATGSNGIELLH